MGLIIDVVDMTDAYAAGTKDGLPTKDTKFMIEHSSGSDEMGRMIDEVAKVAEQKPSVVQVLRIWGHGLLGDGGVQDLGSFRLAANSVATVPDRLASYFCAGARVELHACKVANTTGRDMMLALAKKWHVRVQGSADATFGVLWTTMIYEATPSGDWLKVKPISVYERR